MVWYRTPGSDDTVEQVRILQQGLNEAESAAAASNLEVARLTDLANK